MRTRALAVAAVAALFLLIAVLPVGQPGPPAASAPALSLRPFGAALTDAIGTTYGPIHPWLSNATLVADAPSSIEPLAGGVPNSAPAEEPAPEVPATVPTVLTFGTNVRNCCIEQNFTAPSGPWETIVLNYTGRVVPDVYDSSYRAFVNGVQVLFGTSPEYGTWTVLENLSEYRSLFQGTTNVTFLIGVAVPGGSPGYFLSNLTIAFYPVPAGGTPPPAPPAILPLWFRHPVTSSAQTIYVNATVPANASAAVLEVFAYGFGNDEFWWANSHPVRVLQYGVTGAPLGALLPFPYINTGAIDLDLWRPITGDFTTSNVPYQVNLTGALAAIEGSHEYWANITGIGAGSSWLIGGALLIWTNDSYAGAAAPSTTYSWPRPVISGNSETVTLAASAASTLTTGDGPRAVAYWLNESFAGVVAATTSWSNVSETTSISETTREGEGVNASVETRAYAFPVSADLGGTFVETSNTGGGYPIYGNFTTDLLDVYQEFDSLRSAAETGPLGAATASRDLLDDQLAGAQGVLQGTEEFVAAGAAPLILSTTYISSSSTKQFTQQEGPVGNSSTYSHLQVGVATQPAGPYGAETITADVVRAAPFPLEVRTILNPSIVDAGVPTLVTAGVSGGVAPYAMMWTGLPPGCPATAGPVVACTPDGPGTFSVGVEVLDGSGTLYRAAPAYLAVSPALTAGIRTANAGADAGRVATFTANLSGGTWPFACAWSTSNSSVAVVQACAVPFTVTPLDPGNLTVGYRVVDGGGSNLSSSNLTLAVAPPMTVTLASASAGTVGVPFSLDAAVTGGTPPFAFSWEVNGVPLPGENGSHAVYVPPATGRFNFSVLVTDAAGASAPSAGQPVVVSPVPSPQSAQGIGGVSGAEWLTYLLIALVIGEAVGIALLLRRRNPPRPPSRVARSATPAPTPGRGQSPAARPPAH